MRLPCFLLFVLSFQDQNALDAAREGEEARNNARIAADLIRRYSKPNNHNHAASSHENSPPSLPHKSSGGMSRRSAHAELLSLKLELERCQRALAEEKELHKQTQKALEAAEQTEQSLRTDVENLLHNQETLREDLGRKNDELQRGLKETKERLVTAEQDAELALELAQHNSQAREEIEGWYEQCLGRNLELEASIEQQRHLLLQNGDHHHSEHYANNQHIVPSFSEESRTVEDASISTLETKEASPSRPSSSMVAIGRKLWEQSRNAGSRCDKKMPSLSSVVERAEERNRQLTERRKLFLLEDGTSPVLALTMGTDSHDEANRRISKMLRDSGRRLALPGRWWAKTEEKAAPTPASTENLTKHYCQAVEVSCQVCFSRWE